MNRTPPNHLGAGLAPPWALLDHGRNWGHRPFLFYREGLDWRWLSFAAVAQQAAEGAAALEAALGEAPAERPSAHPVAVPFPVGSHASPEAFAFAVVADLAVQLAGQVSLPVAVPVTEANLGQEQDADGEQDSVSAPSPGSSGDRHATSSPHHDRPSMSPQAGPQLLPPGALPPAAARLWAEVATCAVILPPPPGRFDRPTEPSPSTTAPGGASVAPPVATPAVREILSAEQLAAAPLDLSPAVARPILPWSWVPSTPTTRLTLAWAVRAGAALILEPDPHLWPDIVTWARPTHLAAPAAPLLTLLADEPPRPGRRWPWRRQPGLRPPWDRLRYLLPLTTVDPEAPALRAFEGWVETTSPS